MAREKATITIDRSKLRQLQDLIGVESMSDAIDVALTQVIRLQQLRQDVAAYRAQPQGADEFALGGIPMTLDLDDDEVDYDALYAAK
jgi:hypothetical protein